MIDEITPFHLLPAVSDDGDKPHEANTDGFSVVSAEMEDSAFFHILAVIEFAQFLLENFPRTFKKTPDFPGLADNDKIMRVKGTHETVAASAGAGLQGSRCPLNHICMLIRPVFQEIRLDICNSDICDSVLAELRIDFGKFLDDRRLVRQTGEIVRPEIRIFLPFVQCLNIFLASATPMVPPIIV